MPNQKTAKFAVCHGAKGGLLVRIIAPREIRTRRDLVALVNDTLDKRGFSRRARRQIDLALIWRDIQRCNGSRPCHSFTIENTTPGRRDVLRFQAMRA